METSINKDELSRVFILFLLAVMAFMAGAAVSYLESHIGY